MSKTPQQLQNIRDAIVWWQQIKPEQVIRKLDTWRADDSDCGVVACFGGHCALQPSLGAQGIRVDRIGAPYINVDDSRAFEYGVAEVLFGDRKLFMWRDGYVETDEGFTGTDHELVTYRLEYALAQG